MATSTAARWAWLALLLLLAGPVAADWRSAVPAAQLSGSGDFTWFGVRLYSARLWSSGPVQGGQQPFALELRYHVELSRDTLVQASLKEMRRLGAAPQQLDAWRGWLEAAFVDVRPGQRITGVYLPGLGCRFYVDDRLHHEIGDTAFAKAFFAIWLGEGARDQQLRARLLGR
ncbi:chalcone isomerase family protein [Pseudomonas sp. KnCO4]|uniref:chalcone isomerase family protein n=1 Tax=Pseudomonas sp. KnCO4 TaxID=3381355 RepID=UPI003877AFC8